MAAVDVDLDTLDPTEDDFLHRLVFLNMHGRLAQHLEPYSKQHPYPGIDALDHRGHTPLTMALSLGYTEIAKLLINAGASTLSKNGDNWLPLQEATSYGNREMIELILAQRNEELTTWYEAKGQRIVEELNKTVPNFYLEMTWSFSSWVPLLARLCPCDTYKIWKRDTSVRVDTTLIGLENLRWIRGDVSIIFKVDDEQGPVTYLVDHENKVYQKVYPPRQREDTEESRAQTVSYSLRTSIFTVPHVPVDQIKFSRATTGWWRKEERNEAVGAFQTRVWNVDGIKVISKTRKEHLDEVEAWDKKEKERKAALDTAKGSDGAPQKPVEKEKTSAVISTSPDGEDPGAVPGSFDDVEVPETEEDVERMLNDVASSYDSLKQFVPSLPQPPFPSITYNEYFTAANTDYVHLGRPRKVKESSYNFSAQLWMTADGNDAQAVGAVGSMPDLDTIMPLLDLLGFGSNSHMTQLREVMGAKLPEGFPVKIELPILSVLKAIVTFHNFSSTHPIDKSMFDISPQYKPGIVIQRLADDEGVL
ncbi:GPCR-chaperone-domain-containing protein [Hyaloraphidium curvatum]|nr:GPCR-chaperone-domain-containing protein [Hyaloraphidium curvatum]